MITAKSNIKEVISGIIGKLDSLQPGGVGYGSTMREVATTMRAEMGRRIHSEGKNAQGSDIGNYSTKPMYVSVSANPGRSFGRPIGKTGKSKFAGGKKKGQDHKSRYFSGGYNQYKTAIGRNRLGKVNLSLSGQQASQFSIAETPKGYGLGWANAEMQKRAGYQEKKYGKIWGLTQQEKELANKIAQKKIQEIFN